MNDKETILKAWDIAEEMKATNPKLNWPPIYIEWFNSALHKIENNQPVPRFTLTAAQALLEQENQK